MANWCLNMVTFEADETVMEQIRLLFTKMAEKEKRTNWGQLPDFYNKDGGYLFEIDVQDSQITYLTKWSPNLSVLVAVADQFGVSFIYNYQELCMCIYGMAIYRNGVLHDIALEMADFGSFDFLQETQCYFFEERHYNDEEDILEIFLQRKVKSLYKPNP